MHAFRECQVARGDAGQIESSGDSTLGGREGQDRPFGWVLSIEFDGSVGQSQRGIWLTIALVAESGISE